MSIGCENTPATNKINTIKTYQILVVPFSCSEQQALYDGFTRHDSSRLDRDLHKYLHVVPLWSIMYSVYIACQSLLTWDEHSLWENPFPKTSKFRKNVASLSGRSPKPSNTQIQSLGLLPPISRQQLHPETHGDTPPWPSSAMRPFLGGWHLPPKNTSLGILEPQRRERLCSDFFFVCRSSITS